MDIKKEIGLRIKALRSESRITQEELSHSSGVDKTYISEVENGKRNISVVNLEKIILALNKDFNSFFTQAPFSNKVISNGE
jgi:transcriptional regulator with XRE-family HTH domain